MRRLIPLHRTVPILLVVFAAACADDLSTTVTEPSKCTVTETSLQ